MQPYCLGAGVGLASVDFLVLFLWVFFVVLEVVVPASDFLVVVEESVFEDSEVFEVSVAGLAVGAGAADCWAIAARSTS